MEIEVNKIIDEEQYQRDLDIDLADIDGAARKQSAMFAYYANIAVRCRGQQDRLKQHLELVESILDGKYRTQMKEENPKITEAQIRAAVIKDAKRREVHQKVLDAELQFRFAQNCERAFEHRLSMIQLIGRNQMKEREGQLRLTANQDARERVMSAMQRNSATLE